MQLPKYKLLRINRTSNTVSKLETGMTVYPGADCYGCASEDSRSTGVEHMACSVNEDGLPFFTIPKDDVEQLPLG